MKEKDVIRDVLKHAKARNIPYIRLAMQVGVSAGWPDYVFLTPGGRALFIEFKAPGRKPTALQAARLKTLAQQDYYAYVVDSVAYGVSLLEAHL